MKITRSLRVSPSSIDVFFKCSMQFKWNVLDEMIPDNGSDNLYAVLGSAMHKMMELNAIYDLSYDELVPAWKVMFMSFLSDAKNLPEHTDHESFLSRGYDLLKGAFELRNRWSHLSIVKAEKYFRVSYENRFIEDVYLSGRVDLIVKSDEENIYTAIDWKSAKTKNNKIDEDLQMAFYIFFIHKVYNVPYENIYASLVYPAITEALFTQRTESQIESVFKKVDLMLERISKSDFKKEPKMNYRIGDCHFCPFQISCDKM